MSTQWNFNVYHRSPNQKNNQFEKFLSLFKDLINEITPSNPFFYLILGDFNAQPDEKY